MKTFIVASGAIILLIFFPLQFVIEQVNHYKMNTVNNIVHKHAQQARTDGYFTDENIEELKNEIAAALKIGVGQVSFEGTQIPQYRFDAFDEREMIAYKVTIPIDRVIAMNRFWGISDAENELDYTVEGQVPSELLEP